MTARRLASVLRRRLRGGNPAGARTAFFSDAAAHTRHVSVDTGFGTFLVGTADRKVARQIFEQRQVKELRMLRRVAAVLDGLPGLEVVGRTLVDVGANIGTTSVSALTALPFGAVVSCEPDPENALLLQANLLLNGLQSRASVLQTAISDTVGEATLARHRTNAGAHELATDGGELPEAFGERLVVPVTTIDRLVAEGRIDPDDVALLWLDAQGREGHVLTGATSLVERGVPILFELYPAGLRRAGGIELLLVAASAYPCFVDVRRLKSSGALVEATRPVSELRRVLDALEGERHTDILLLPRPTDPRKPAARLDP